MRPELILDQTLFGRALSRRLKYKGCEPIATHLAAAQPAASPEAISSQLVFLVAANLFTDLALTPAPPLSPPTLSAPASPAPSAPKAPARARTKKQK